jgi:hypothetical protein
MILRLLLLFGIGLAAAACGDDDYNNDGGVQPDLSASVSDLAAHD